MTITVKDLIKQLTTLAENGYADASIVYLDDNDISHDVSEGVHDIYRYGDKPIIVLG